MFKNAGLKLSIFASVLYAVIVICSAVVLLMGGMNGNLNLIAVVSVVIILLSSYIACLAISAFGDLVEDVRSINLHLSVANKIALGKKPSPVSGQKSAESAES